MSEQLNINITGTFNDQLTQATNKAKSALQSLQTTTQEFADSASTAGSNAGKSASGLNKMRSAVQNVSTKVKAFATALPGLINGLGNVATSATMLYRSYRDLEDTQIKVDRATRNLSLATDAESKAQAKVNDLVAAGKKGTPEYKQALLDLEQAQQKVGIQTDMLAEAQEAQSDAYTDFYMSIVPGVLGVLGTLVSTIQGVRAAQMEATLATNAGTTATTQMTAAMRAVRIAMIAIPFVAIATALLAIKTNAGGFRDMLNEIGEKIGNAIPQLKGFLQWLKDLAEAFGLTEKAMDLSKAWDLLVSGFQSAVDKLKTTDWKSVINTIVTGISTFIKNFNWEDAWQSFKDALADTGKWLAPIVEDIASFISETISSEGPKWWAGFQEALGATAAWVGTGIRKIGSAIIGAIKSAAVGWWIGFQNALGNATEWVGTQLKKIGEAITNWANWKTVGETIWSKISEGLSSAASSIGSAAGGFLDTIKNAIFGAGGLQSVFADEGGGGGMFFTPFIDLNLYNQKLAELKTSTQQTTLAVTQLFNSMSTSIQNTLTTMAAKIPTIFVPLQTNAQLVTSNVSAAFSTMWTSVTSSLTRMSATFPTAFAPLLPAAQQATAQTSAQFINMETSISNTLTRITNAFNTFANTITTTSNNAGNGVLNGFVTPASKGMEIFIKAYTATAQGYQAFASSINKSSTNASASISTMNSSVGTSLSAMTSKANSFASAVTSAFNKVGSAATSNASKVAQLRKEIDALKSKTITITVKYNVQKPSGLMHGGSFLNTHAQHGFSGIVNQPTKYGGVRMGEGFKQELVTVTPMTRGTGNTSGLTRASTGGGSSRPIIIENYLMLDGQVIDKRIRKVALDGYGLQV